MAKTVTEPITVVEGDDAPDLYITLQQDSTGSPYNLVDRSAFAVLVERGNNEEYIHKFPLDIVDPGKGLVRLSWVKEPTTLESYLDDLEAGKRYEVQIFLGRTNLPPTYLEITNSEYPYFSGKYYFTGLWQEGCPTFKHEYEDLYISRSSYSGNGVDGEYVWLITSLRAAVWEDVKDQDKDALTPPDLELTPVWNYKQVLTSDVEQDFTLSPDPDTALIPDSSWIITPEGKFKPEYNIEVINAGMEDINGEYVEDTPLSYHHADNDDRDYDQTRFISYDYDDVIGNQWLMHSPEKYQVWMRSKTKIIQPDQAAHIAYIDLNWAPTDVTSVKFKMWAKVHPNTDIDDGDLHFMFGSRYSDDDRYMFGVLNGKWWVEYGDHSFTSQVAADYSNHFFEFSSAGLKVDNTTVIAISGVNAPDVSTISCYLGAPNIPNYPHYGIDMEVVEVYINDELLYDFHVAGEPNTVPSHISSIPDGDISSDIDLSEFWVPTMYPELMSYYKNTASPSELPLEGWTSLSSGYDPPPDILAGALKVLHIEDPIANNPIDTETQGTQTVLTRIPIIVKPAYRLHAP